MKNIVLVGFMGSGKTTVGKLVAQALNMKYVNTDDMIVKREAVSINDIFTGKGEAYFRKVEREVIMEVSKDGDSVIDAGGGVVIDELNVKDLKESGMIFCLKATPEETLRRVEKHSHRPLLSVADPLSEIKRLLIKREGFYKRADHQIDTTGKTADEVTKEIIKIYKG